MSPWPADWGKLPPEILDLCTKLARTFERMTQWLELALALESDEPLRAAVRLVAPEGACALALAEGGPYLCFAEGKVEGAGSLRGEEPPLATTFDVAQAIAENPTFGAVVKSRLKVSGARAEAERLVRALQGGADHLSVDDFNAALHWASLLAVDAYLHTSLTQMLLDQTRPLVRSKPTEGILRWHWGQIHALSHWTLLATSAEPTAWLSTMAKSFEWETWTPSFPLVRERVLRLAVRGAWAAARFGPSVIEPYLRFIVDAPHLLRTFDAVLGATAIALGSWTDRARLKRAIERALEKRTARAVDENERWVLRACGRSVAVAMEDPRLAEQMTLTRGLVQASVRRVRDDANVRKLALSLALDDDIDGAEIDDEGYMPAIIALPGVVSAPASIFFPAPGTASRQTGEHAARLRGVPERTLGSALCSCGSGRPARECCAN
jgi:hypothetical protein